MRSWPKLLELVCFGTRFNVEVRAAGRMLRTLVRALVRRALCHWSVDVQVGSRGTSMTGSKLARAQRRLQCGARRASRSGPKSLAIQTRMPHFLRTRQRPVRPTDLIGPVVCPLAREKVCSPLPKPCPATRVLKRKGPSTGLHDGRGDAHANGHVHVFGWRTGFRLDGLHEDAAEPGPSWALIMPNAALDLAVTRHGLQVAAVQVS